MDSPDLLKRPTKCLQGIPELLAPAGNWECLKAAVSNGADAVYFGLTGFNARMRADNFTLQDLPSVMAFLHGHGVRGYVTMNTLVFADELAAVEEQLRSIMAADVDAVIVQDIGLCHMIRNLSPDFPIHASTQMTLTSPAGIDHAKELGVNLAVLARECSMVDIRAIQESNRQCMPLEIFVHGALCVAYSGQCLTSEALGGRSANRGECAQACRMPYELIQDGKPLALGDRQYLLSPQDLAGLEVLDQLMELGLSSLKIEGRLKSPTYVANITRIYRNAIDRIANQSPEKPESDSNNHEQSRYEMEMSFSRGLHTGWLKGIDNQKLVHARFGKKRGVFLGTIQSVHRNGFSLESDQPVKAGDGIVVDQGNPGQKEMGGRIFQVIQGPSKNPKPGKERLRLVFDRNRLDTTTLKKGDRIWKTSDPALEKQLRQTYEHVSPQADLQVIFEVHGQLGQPLELTAKLASGAIARSLSETPLQRAVKHPLSAESLKKQLGRLGGSGFRLGDLHLHLDPNLMLPVSELNRIRRSVVESLQKNQPSSIKPSRWKAASESLKWPRFTARSEEVETQESSHHLIPLVRNMDQLQAVLQLHYPQVYCDFEQPKSYRDAVALFRDARGTSPTSRTAKSGIWLTGPRITKPGEAWILNQLLSACPDGFLVRNYDQLKAFDTYPCIADFSMNVSNAWSAFHFLKRHSMQRITASYDLNMGQLEALLRTVPPERVEITLHQHMPMFHMEHCVFCTFMSTGKDYRDCGRPCEKHQVELKDRVGLSHPLIADAGCRNTVFNARAQSGSEHAHTLQTLGAAHFRIEFLRETPDEVASILAAYTDLLEGRRSGTSVWKDLKCLHQLGVTRGTLETSGRSVG